MAISVCRCERFSLPPLLGPSDGRAALEFLGRLDNILSVKVPVTIRPDGEIHTLIRRILAADGRPT